MVTRARYTKKEKEDKIDYPNIKTYVESKIEPHIGKTQIELYEELYKKPINKSIPKNLNKLISDKLLGKDEELTKRFPNEKFIIKNIPLIENGLAKERMAFRNLRISDFYDEWENSFWKDYFEKTIILICYAEKNKSKNGYRILTHTKTIKFNEKDLESFKKTYNQIKSAIKFEDIQLLPRPNSFEGQILELAQKGQKGTKGYTTFFKENVTKTCFMINKNFLNEKLKNEY